MEHFNFNPIPFVKDLKKICHHGGAVLVTVPNSVSISHRITTLLGRSPTIKTEAFIKDYEEELTYPYHWHEYSMKDLVKLFQYCGFKVIHKAFIKGDKLCYVNIKDVHEKFRKSIEHMIYFLFSFVPQWRERIFLYCRKL